MSGPRNPVLAAKGRAVRAALREVLAQVRCPHCGHKPTTKEIKAKLPLPFAELGDADVCHHLRLIARGVE